MNPIRFGLIGGGWRAEFFIRIAQALPHLFEISKVLVRDSAKAQVFGKRLNVKTCTTLEELLAGEKLSFVVTSVPRKANVDMCAQLLASNMPVLSETPPGQAEDLNQVWQLHEKGLRIQVAEQLHLRPMHAARIAIARSGLLGNVHHAKVSVAHGYHGISLIRRLLGITFEDVRITACRVPSTIAAGPGRDGPPKAEAVEKDMQELGWFDFGDRFAQFDFAGSQYFSYIRSTGMIVQGDRGEIHDMDVRYLKDFKTPIHTTLTRHAAGENDNLEGCFFKGIQAGDSWVYTNPYAAGRLSDDEIAIASCLQKMHEYVQGGQAFYSLAEACQDFYLADLMTAAAQSGLPCQSEKQVWAS